MEILIAAIVGMAQALLTELAKKMGWNKYYILLIGSLLIGILVITFQQLFGNVVWEKAVGFTMQAFSVATVVYLALLKKGE